MKCTSTLIPFNYSSVPPLKIMPLCTKSPSYTLYKQNTDNAWGHQAIVKETPTTKQLVFCYICSILYSDDVMFGIYKAVDGTAPAYLQTLVKPHSPARSLRSTTPAGRLVQPSLRANKGRSAKIATLLCPGTTMVERAPFCRRLKTNLFRVHLVSIVPPSSPPPHPPLYVVHPGT